MIRVVAVWLLGVELLQLSAAARARGCPPVARPFAQASASGLLELIVEPDERERRDGKGRGMPGARYRLVRAGSASASIWEATSDDFPAQALVANDGDYVVTAFPVYEGPAITIRNSAGAVIRSLTEQDLISIPEKLDGAMWRIVGLDPGEEYLEIEVSRFGESGAEHERVALRRVQLMDVRVVDAPVVPPDFALPRIDCPAHTTLAVHADSAGLALTCAGEEDGPRFGRSYALEDGDLLLVDEFSRDARGDVQVRWLKREAGAPAERCESIYRGGELVSERCGEDVEPPS
ncbi:MAG TPA: hypothetical protein VFT98_11540 [Myxococcota bacterium]|nr:hypothetical protein [Myxococcota bacterium]